MQLKQLLKGERKWEPASVTSVIFQMVSWLLFSSLLPICNQTDNLGSLLPLFQADKLISFYFFLLLDGRLVKEQFSLCASSPCLFKWKKFHEMRIYLQLSEWSYSSFTCLLLVIWFPFNNSRHTLSLLHQPLYVIHGYQGLEKSIHSFSLSQRQGSWSQLSCFRCDQGEEAGQGFSPVHLHTHQQITSLEWFYTAVVRVLTMPWNLWMVWVWGWRDL